MHKISIKEKDLSEWMDEFHNLYASQNFNGELLRLWANGHGRFLVKHGDRVLYEGSQMTHAVAAWDTA